MKDFGELWDATWSEYKTKIMSFVKLSLFSILLVFIILLILGVPAGLLVWKNVLIGAIPLIIIAIILFFLVFVWIGASSIYFALSDKSKKMTLRQMLSGGKKFFGKYLWVSIVSGLLLLILLGIPIIPWALLLALVGENIIFGILLLIPLSFVLLIPFIMFTVYWTFRYFVVIDKNTSTWEALKTSKNIVKGKWWLTLVYVILISFIIGIIIFISSLPQGIGSGIIDSYNESIVKSTSVFIIGGIILVIGILIRIATQILATPFKVLFMKNFYTEMKNRKK